VPEPWLSSQGGVHSQMNGLVVKTGAGSKYSPFEAKRFARDVGLMVEKTKDVFYKNKGYRYKDELRSKKIATIPWQWCQKDCWYFLTFTKVNSQAYGFTVVAFTHMYLGYHIFPQGMEVFLLANSSKDNTRIANEGREGFLWLRV
jgi:hypothetical protein